MHIDYGTWTSSSPSEFAASAQICRQRAGDNKAKKQEFYGFTGIRFEDDQAGTRFIGVRESDGYSMISCSGQAAHTEAERLRFLSCWRPSRIDIAVDVAKHFDVPTAYARWQGSTKVKIAAIENETLYIGSRKSEMFWRIYDKAAEMGRPELSPLWRFEIELKGERAKQFWSIWQEGRADLPGILRGYLWRPDGSPREPMNSLVSPYLEATEAWHIGALPRRRRAGEAYFWQNVLPFLKENWEWAGPLVKEQLIERSE